MDIDDKKACPLCQEPSNPIIMVTKDYRFGTNGWYKFAKCKKCKFVYLLNPPTNQALNKLYDDNYQPADLSKVAKHAFSLPRKIWWSLNGYYFTELGKEVSKNSGYKILDLGFGQAPTLFYLKKLGFDVYGVETNFKIVKSAQKAGIKAHFGSLEEIQFPDNFFHIVILSQVLEHLPQPKKTLREIFRILAPGGKVYIYVPNERGYLSWLFKRYWHGWYAPFHYFVFNKHNLQLLAEACGFSISKFKTFTPTNFFTVSLRSFLLRKQNNKVGKKLWLSLVENPLIKLPLALLLRLIDLLMPNRGDCLKVVLVKNEKTNSKRY